MTDTAVEPIVPGSLRDTIRREIDGYLRDPLAFPSEFVSWIPQRVEQVGILSPRSNLIGVYTTADTVSGLGEAVHGRTCMVRAGSSPFFFAQLTYDDVYSKWISDAVLVATVITFTTSNTSGVWTSLSETATAYTRTQIPGFKALYDAGLRPQTHIMSFGSSNVGNTNSLRPTIYEFSVGDSSLNKIAHGGQLDWSGSATQTWRATSNWSDVTFTATPTETEAVLFVQFDADMASTFTNTSILMRWVADRV